MTIIQSSFYTLTLSDETGAITSLFWRERQMIAPAQAPRALFGLRLRDAQGQPLDVTSLDAAPPQITREERIRQTILTLEYEALKGLNLRARVTLRCPHDESFTYWRIEVDNNTGLALDHIDFPNVIVPNDLKGSGGDATVFRPDVEGVLIEDLDLARAGFCPPKPVEFPYTGWGYGLYPATITMQFMSYYCADGRGLYLAAHDTLCNTKGVALVEHPEGLWLNFRLFPGAVSGEYAMPYEMALGCFMGDWYTAADIYRDWRENWQTGMPLGPKLSDNPRIPDWFEQSPVVAVYPVRGQKDTGDMTPNMYYPYPAAVPVMRSLSAKFGSPVLALLAHWEHTAPWAPPYCWPPFGGVESFTQFVEQMHAAGQLVGLYTSGLGYTLRSMVDKSYHMEAEFEARHLDQVMTVAPNGKLAENGVCVGENAQRLGYDMCPATPFAQEVTQQEFAKVLGSGADYLQYFDQNLGGGAYFCYARNHQHPPAPGRWMGEAMIRIYRDLQKQVDESGRKVPIGTEAAAAEPFTPYLFLNDLRYEVNFCEGTPVPAYAYVFHEYLNNFMGNQNCVEVFTDISSTPLHLNLRLAYSFIAGDLMTVVLAGGERINWCWGILWDQPMPDQASATTLIHNLNAWRKERGKPYLVYGRMLRPFRLEGAYDVVVGNKQGKAFHFASLLTSQWQSPEGHTAQVVANYTHEPQKCRLYAAPFEYTEVVVYADPAEAGLPPSTVKLDAEWAVELDIPALSAVLVEFGAG